MSNKNTNLKSIHAKLTKIAQDELAITNKMQEQATAPSEAGPQEVVNAIAEIADDIESVMAIIPAEPQSGQPDDGDATDNLDNESEDNTPIDPEKEQLAAQIAILTEKVDKQEKAKIAQEIAELYGGSEAKYAEIVNSDKSSRYWAGQLDVIKSFSDEMGLDKSKVAQTSSSYVKLAKLADMTPQKNLML